MTWKNKISIIIAILFVIQPTKSEARFPIWQDSLYVNESKHTKLIQRCTFQTFWTKDERNEFTRLHGLMPGFVMSKTLDQLNDEYFDMIYNLHPTLIPYEYNGKKANAVIDHSCNALKKATLLVLNDFSAWYSDQRPYCFGLAHTKGECAFYTLYAATVFTIAGIAVAGSTTWSASVAAAPVVEEESEEYARAGIIIKAARQTMYFIGQWVGGKVLDGLMGPYHANPCSDDSLSRMGYKPNEIVCTDADGRMWQDGSTAPNLPIGE